MTLNVFSHVNFPFNNKINKIFKKTHHVPKNSSERRAEQL